MEADGADVVRTFAVALLVVGCGATRAGSVRGGPDVSHAAIVRLSSDCSGVLVASARVLTAAHCVSGPIAPSVTVESERGTWRGDVIACAPHPSAVPSGATDCAHVDPEATDRAHDLAMLTLAAPVPAEIAEPMPLVSVAPLVGEHVGVVAWMRPTPIAAARRYVGWNVVRAIEDGALVIDPIGDEGFRTDAGASGGAVLRVDDDGERVVGVVFGGTEPSSAATVAALVGENADWIAHALE